MSEVAVRVCGLSKKYRVGQRWSNYWLSFKDTLVQQLSLLGRPDAKPHEADFWALQDVSFEVDAGQAFGIIGRNGAGKSTLLRILSRITRPTLGFAEVHGRARSLLEVGTGFHPELTGRENVFLNGAYMGMPRREIERKLDSIVEFAEVGRFLDTPVKRYSSGMYIRLAFAVAAYLEPEILIVDEILAVGDQAFQRRCLGKMKDAGRDGRTVIFVSHDLQAVSALTNRCLVLSAGRVAFHGTTADAVHFYLKQSGAEGLSYTAEASPVLPRITRIQLLTTEPSNVQQWGHPMDLDIEVSLPLPTLPATLLVQCCTALQQPMFFVSTEPAEFGTRPGTWRLRCHLDKLRLFLGKYSFRLTLQEEGGGTVHDVVQDACPFEVTRLGGEVVRNSDQFGVYAEDASWTSELTGAAEAVQVASELGR